MGKAIKGRLVKEFAALALAIPLVTGQAAMADATQPADQSPLSGYDVAKMLSVNYGVIDLPDCAMGDGTPVRYMGVPTSVMLGVFDRIVAISLNLDKVPDHKPTVAYDAQFVPYLPPAVQKLVFRHECEHVKLGHIKGNPSSQEEAAADEDAADCNAIKELHAEGIKQPDLDLIKRYNYAIGQVFHQPVATMTTRNTKLQACFDSPTPAF